MIYLKYDIYIIVWNSNSISNLFDFVLFIFELNSNCFPKIQKFHKGHVEIYRTHVDDLNQFHQRKRNLDLFSRFYLKARKFPGFSMHEWNAHVCVISICCLKFSGCYTHGKDSVTVQSFDDARQSFVHGKE